MIRRLFVLLMLSLIVIGGAASVRPAQSANPEPCSQDHEAWLKRVVKKIETIKPGMTRWDVLKVFRTEGGPSIVRTEGGPPTRLRQSFVSQDCAYLKIDVEFEPVARPNGGLGFSAEDNRDVIVKVSKPYVQFANTN